MEIIVTIPDELVPDLEATLPMIPGPMGPSPEIPDDLPIEERLRKQWENEIDQRVTAHLVQQAQADASAKVAAARAASDAEVTPLEASFEVSTKLNTANTEEIK